MLILLYITVILLLAYGLLIRFYHHAWKSMPNFYLKPGDIEATGTTISVVIPARNEEKNIAHCLECLSLQTYPKTLLDIIVVNDHSTDNTASMVASCGYSNVRLVNLSEYIGNESLNSYKKKAIETGIAKSSAELIVSTDADCFAKPGWIKSIADFHFQNNAVFIAAPVKINPGPTLLSIFQSLDFVTLQGITGASVYKHFHMMCNGANMAYERATFYEVGGFKGIDTIASGDDLLLMEKISNSHPQKIFFLKSRDAIVSTEAAPSWKAFMNQRVRWASKAGHYKDKKITAVLLLVYLLNVFLLVFFFAGFFNPFWFFLFLLLISTKTIFEFAFVRTVARFFSLHDLMMYFPFLQPIHIVYTVIAGWLGIFGKYEWKDRRVK